MAALSVGSIAHGDTPQEEAKAHLTRALRAFDVQQYDVAVSELQKAYVLDPQPDYIYALGQAFRLSGDCTRAIRAYEQYLKTNPNPKDAAKARANIERCKAEPSPGIRAPAGQSMTPSPIAPATPATVTTDVAPAPVAAPLPAPSEPSDTPGWTRDYIGHALVGGGIVVGVVGIVLFTSGRSTINSINSSTTYDQLESRQGEISSAELRQNLGVTSMLAGTALVIGGVVHYAFVGSRASSVSASITPGTAVLQLAGTF